MGSLLFCSTVWAPILLAEQYNTTSALIKASEDNDLSVRDLQRYYAPLDTPIAFLNANGKNAYVSTFYNNLGNYYTNVDNGKGVNSNTTLLHWSPGIWAKTERLIYELGPRYRTLGFGPAALTTYFSANRDASDAKLVKDFLVSHNVEAWNSRVIKTFDRHNGQPNYEIRFASSWTKASLEGDAKHRQEVDGMWAWHYSLMGVASRLLEARWKDSAQEIQLNGKGNDSVPSWIVTRTGMWMEWYWT
ncbi:hypothetical protein BV898_01095 [Hypsibius exemplaris]|uniref:Uncharacterized protein n=1 Tax=Hypsibius exemplaris TaxID=2072580 RepID=A0A1W0XD66_HYPEX|nr:hypothetical protein BV898_01095 [Hypsibius exemplaris]